MKLHGNAALSWSGRRRLAERVVIEGWSVKATAEAAGVSVRCARKWIGRFRLEGERGLHDRSSAPRRVANRTSQERVQAIIALRHLRFTAAEIAEALGWRSRPCLRILRRRVWASSAASGSSNPCATSAAVPVSCACRRQATRPDRGRRRQACLRERAPPAAQPPSDRPRRGAPLPGRLRVRTRLHRRLQPPRLRRGAARRAAADGGRLPRACRRLLPPARDQGRAAAHRQRLRLRLGRARARLPPPRHPPSAHAPLPPADERQGGALHPHARRWLGVRRHLPLERGALSRP